MNSSRNKLARLTAICAVGLAVGVNGWDAAAAVERPSSLSRMASHRHARIPVRLLDGTDTRGAMPSAEALKFANELLDPRLPRGVQAELPDLAKPQGPDSAPSARQGDDLQLWPESKLVPVPTSDDPLVARLRDPFH